MSGDFDKIAQIYAPGAAEFVERLALGSGERVLDVACGTGNLSFPASRAGARVVGLDIAPNLLETARARAQAEGLEIRFDEGDADQLPYEDAAFDTVITMFGAMFAPRPEKVAAELIRVSRPGGRIAMANWTPTGFIGQMFKTTSAHVPPPPLITQCGFRIERMEMAYLAAFPKSWAHCCWGVAIAIHDNVGPVAEELLETGMETNEILTAGSGYQSFMGRWSRAAARNQMNVSFSSFSIIPYLRMKST